MMLNDQKIEKKTFGLQTCKVNQCFSTLVFLLKFCIVTYVFFAKYLSSNIEHIYQVSDGSHRFSVL